MAGQQRLTVISRTCLQVAACCQGTKELQRTNQLQSIVHAVLSLPGCQDHAQTAAACRHEQMPQGNRLTCSFSLASVCRRDMTSCHSALSLASASSASLFHSLPAACTGAGGWGAGPCCCCGAAGKASDTAASKSCSMRRRWAAVQPARQPKSCLRKGRSRSGPSDAVRS